MRLVVFREGVRGWGMWVHAFRMRELWAASSPVCNFQLVLGIVGAVTSQKESKISGIDTQAPWRVATHIVSPFVLSLVVLCS